MYLCEMIYDILDFGVSYTFHNSNLIAWKVYFVLCLIISPRVTHRHCLLRFVLNKVNSVGILRSLQWLIYVREMFLLWFNALWLSFYMYVYRHLSLCFNRTIHNITRRLPLLGQADIHQITRSSEARNIGIQLHHFI